MNLKAIAAANFAVMTCGAVIFAGMTSAAMAAPPKELYGKSVTISWNETRSQRDGQSGPFKPVSIPYVVVYYVSSEGRLFQRVTAKGGSGAGFGSSDMVGTGGR